MGKSVREWLREGEELYNAALREFQAVEAQIDQLQAQLVVKREEANQFAQVLGRPGVDGVARRPAVQIIDGHAPGSVPASRMTIAKALAGRGLGT